MKSRSNKKLGKGEWDGSGMSKMWMICVNDVLPLFKIAVGRDKVCLFWFVV